MRLRGFVSRRRFLLSALRDKVSRGTEQLPRVPLPAALHIVSPQPDHKKRYGGTYNDYHQFARLLRGNRQGAASAAPCDFIPFPDRMK